MLGAINSTNGLRRFRWAYCQLQELKKLKSLKPKYVRDTLRSLPPTLDETYERMLLGIEEMFRKEALILLQWLAYAQSPPSLDQLAEAAIVDPNADTGVDMDNRGGWEDTLEILAGLVTVEGDYNEFDEECWEGAESSNISSMYSGQRIGKTNKIRFAHFSVKEYLQSKRIVQNKVKEFHLESAIGHRCLAQSCLTYISYYSHSWEKASPTMQDREAFPLLEYAARSWYYHSYRQQSRDPNHEISLLTSEKAREDWLFLHQLDRAWYRPYERIGSVGSGLYYASLLGLRNVAEALSTAGGDVNAQGGRDGNALQAASARGYNKIVQLLLNKGADVNAQGGCHVKALQAASQGGHSKIVQLLLDKGARFDT